MIDALPTASEEEKQRYRDGLEKTAERVAIFQGSFDLSTHASRLAMINALPTASEEEKQRYRDGLDKTAEISAIFQGVLDLSTHPKKHAMIDATKHTSEEEKARMHQSLWTTARRLNITKEEATNLVAAARTDEEHKFAASCLSSTGSRAPRQRGYPKAELEVAERLFWKVCKERPQFRILPKQIPLGQQWLAVKAPEKTPAFSVWYNDLKSEGRNRRVKYYMDLHDKDLTPVLSDFKDAMTLFTEAVMAKKKLIREADILQKRSVPGVHEGPLDAFVSVMPTSTEHADVPHPWLGAMFTDSKHKSQPTTISPTAEEPRTTKATKKRKFTHDAAPSDNSVVLPSPPAAPQTVKNQTSVKRVKKENVKTVYSKKGVSPAASRGAGPLYDFFFQQHGNS
jgi:hypothetical protein